MSAVYWRLMCMVGLVAAAIILVLTACAEDGKGRTDLPEENISLDTDPMDVIVSADGFPNIGHRCFTSNGTVVGLWTTTDRTLVMIFNDYTCEGASTEREMTVVNAVPRAVVNASG